MHKDEQAAIQLIAELHLAGRSLREIGAILAEHGIPSKRGAQWHPTTL